MRMDKGRKLAQMPDDAKLIAMVVSEASMSAIMP
jgi:hypothetical protein